MPVVKIKGKQFVISQGKEILVPHLQNETGEKFSEEDLLTGKTINLEVVGHKRDKKIRVVKFRNKTRYKRVLGHRSLNTKIVMVKEKADQKEKSKEVKPKVIKRVSKLKKSVSKKA